MERYEYLETISSGAYGVCYRVLDTATGQHCAAKGIKQAHENAEVMRLTLREVKVLKTLPPHVNIVKLLEAFRSHSGRVYLVFEYVERSLYQELERHPSGALPGPMVKSVAFQLLHALGHCHEHGFMHRDVKPANVLLTGYIPGVGSGGVVKLCDFGFARAVSSSGAGRAGGAGAGLGAGAAGLSSYVMTRWYRPPEVLVGDVYDTSIDVWSYGCTLAELATGRPLFPGRSTVDQLWRIMRCLGPLSVQQTACMRRDTRLQPVWTPPQRLKTLRQRLPDLDPRLYEVVSACLTLDPQRRPTIQQLLQMPYFWDVRALIANTDLARQLPYAAEVACTISFRQPMATPAAASAVKQAAIPSGHLNRTDASPPPERETAAATMDDSRTAQLATASAENPKPPKPAVPAAASAVGSRHNDDDDNAAAAATAPVIAQGAFVQFVGDQGLASTQPLILPTQPKQSQQHSHGGVGIASDVLNVSNITSQSSEGTIAATIGTACTDATKGMTTSAATVANDLTAAATGKSGLGSDAAADAAGSGSSGGGCGGGAVSPRVPHSTALTAQMVAASNAANAAAAATVAAAAATAASAAAATNAAVAAAAASAAASAAAAMAIGAYNATHGKAIPNPSQLLPLPINLPRSSVQSAAPRTPARENDLSAMAADQRSGGKASSVAGPYRSAAVAATAVAATAVAAPGDVMQKEEAAVPAPPNSLRVLDAACLYQALSGNGGSELTHGSAASTLPSSDSRAPVIVVTAAAATATDNPQPFAAARLKAAAGGTAGGAATAAATAEMGSAIAGGPLAFQPSSFQYEVHSAVRSGASVSYLGDAVAFTGYNGTDLPQMDSGGLLYLPLGNGEEGISRIKMPMAAAA
ncbi:hypothetical protein VaNZ11_006758, partial [Volvox africanus]